eukprot:3071565-Pleurochrysis_carterae.AAC.3
MKANMWDHADILKIGRVLPSCMALTAGIVPSEARRMIYTWRWTLSQMIAASMRSNFEVPLFSREELRRNLLLNERVDVQW